MEKDSRVTDLAQLMKKISPETRIPAIARNAETEELLRQAGAHHTLPIRFLGRTIASNVFEPKAPEVIREPTTRRGQADLIGKQ